MHRQHREQAAFLGTAQPHGAVGSDHLDRAENAHQRGRHRTTFAAAVRGVQMPAVLPGDAGQCATVGFRERALVLSRNNLSS